MIGQFHKIPKTNQINSIFPLDGTKVGPPLPKTHKKQASRALKLIVQKIIITDGLGIYLSGIVTMLCLFTSGFHIYMKYQSESSTTKSVMWFSIVDAITCSVYGFEYLLRLYVAPQRIDFFLSTSSFLDIGVVSMFFIFEWMKSSVSIYFISVSRLLRIIRLLDFILQVIKTKMGMINRQILTIVLTIVLLMYISSGILQLFEKLEYHDALYFIVVTLSTIGYGDIVPVTLPGKTVVIVLIVVTFMIIPKQTGDLIALINMRSIYSRAIYKKNEDIDHLILTGNIEIEGATTFCQELFHPDHGNDTKHIIMLQESEPSQEMLWLLRMPQYELLLVYLRVI